MYLFLVCNRRRNNLTLVDFFVLIARSPVMKAGVSL